jgi:hypothetical protein
MSCDSSLCAHIIVYNITYNKTVWKLASFWTLCMRISSWNAAHTRGINKYGRKWYTRSRQLGAQLMAFLTSEHLVRPLIFTITCSSLSLWISIKGVRKKIAVNNKSNNSFAISVEQTPSSGTNSYWVSQEMPSILWSPNVYERINKNTPLTPIMRGRFKITNA